jgi:hypothetical protein
MRFAVWCAKCSIAKVGILQPEHDDPNDRLVAQLRNDFSFETQCAMGHHVRGVVDNPRFEVLFDAGVLALDEGYLRESILDFVGALEDFFVFYVEVALRGQGVAPERIDALRKPNKLSERQLGAMNALYCLNGSGPFDYDDGKMRKFRNDVIHSGKIPDDDEALKYGEYVFNTIERLQMELRVRPGIDVVSFQMQHRSWSSFEAMSKLQRPDRGFTTKSTIGTMLDIMNVERPASFRDACQQWRSGNLWRLAREALSAQRPNP